DLARDRIELNFAHERRVEALTAKRQRHEGGASAVMQQIAELASVERDGLGFRAVSVDNTGHFAGVAKRARFGGTGAVAALDREGQLVCHYSPKRWLPRPV